MIIIIPIMKEGMGEFIIFFFFFLFFFFFFFFSFSLPSIKVIHMNNISDQFFLFSFSIK